MDLIKVEFTDRSIYSDNNVPDIVGTAIDASWGPVGVKTIVNKSKFQNIFAPLTVHDHVTCIRAFEAGAGLMEIVRLQGDALYHQAILTKAGVPSKSSSAKPYTTAIGTNLLVLETKYPGKMPVVNPSVKVDFVPDADRSIVLVKLTGTDLDNNAISETYEGSFIPGDTEDGLDYYICDVINRDSSYLISPCAAEGNAGLGALAAFQDKVMDLIPTAALTPASKSDLASAITAHFSGDSYSTILIGSRGGSEINTALMGVAESRKDVVALLSYDHTADFTAAAIQVDLALYVGKFCIYYAGREIYTYRGLKVTLTGIGTVAGRYCAVAASETINQIPSASIFGKFPGVLAASLTETEVQTLHDEGCNSIYNALGGPQIWGLKTLYERKASFYAKANVMRVIAYFLSTTFPLLKSTLHTANTPSQRAGIEANRQALIDELVVAEVLKADSNAVCNDTNNTDLATSAGEELILDLNLGFVKLIERFKVRINASVTSITVTPV